MQFNFKLKKYKLKCATFYKKRTELLYNSKNLCAKFVSFKKNLIYYFLFTLKH